LAAEQDEEEGEEEGGQGRKHVQEEVDIEVEEFEGFREFLGREELGVVSPFFEEEDLC
jgi:hypothetical protein